MKVSVSDIKIGLRVRYHNASNNLYTDAWQDKVGTIISLHELSVMVHFDDVICGKHAWRVNYDSRATHIDLELVGPEDERLIKERQRREEHAMKFL